MQLCLSLFYKRGGLYSTSLFFFVIFQNDETNNMKQSFQDGVNTIYNKIVSCGQTPSDKSPTNIVNSIDPLLNNYRGQGQNDVINSPNNYGLYNKTQYDQNYNNGYNSGYNAGQASSNFQFTLKIQCNMYQPRYNFNGSITGTCLITVSNNQVTGIQITNNGRGVVYGQDETWLANVYL